MGWGQAQTPAKLRSIHWDGPSPSPGDILAMGPLMVIRAVTAGAGPGHYTLDVEDLRSQDVPDHVRVFRWQPG